MRKTSKDYRNELDKSHTTLESLEAHIKSRLITMIEQFPEAIVLEKGIDKFKAKYVTKQWIEGLSVDTMISYISSIEAHNANLEPYVQAVMYE